MHAQQSRSDAEDWLVSTGWTIRIVDGAWTRGEWLMSPDVCDLGLDVLRSAVSNLDRVPLGVKRGPE